MVFVSDATNLVSDDTNGKSDVFLHDRNTASTTRISVSTSLIQANGDSSSPVISGDATHIAYVSEATNLVSSDGNSATDVFLYNLSSAATTRVSLQTNGLEPNGSSYEPFLNSDASFLVYTSDATNIVSNDSNALSDVFLYNLSTAATERVSLSSSGLNPDGASSAPRVSTSGRHVSFTSAATNLVNGDTNEALDVFVRDRTDALTSRVSVSSSGQQANAASSNAVINADAQYLAFISAATNLLSADTNSVSDVFLTNIECLVDLGSSPSTDTDGDSTLNCNEDCGNDSSKTSPGTCGCGVADTDTDADSSADCDDECDSDASKSEVGRCGCGVSDADSNGNSVADCLDPTSSTVPRRGSVLRRSSRITVIFPGDFTGVTYRVTLRGPSGTITRSTRRVRLRISNLRSGVYKLTYTVTLGSITSLSSSRLRFRLR